MVKPNDESFTAPQLNVVTVDKTLRLLCRLGIFGTNQRLESKEVPVQPNPIRPVFRHARYLVVTIGV